MELEDILDLPAKKRLEELQDLFEKEEDKELLIHISAAEKELEQEKLADISSHLKPDTESTEEEEGDEDKKEESIEDIVSDVQIEKKKEDALLGNLYQSAAGQNLYGTQPPKQDVPQDAYKTTSETSQDSYQDQQPQEAYNSSTQEGKSKKRLNSFGFEEKGDIAGSYHSK